MLPPLKSPLGQGRVSPADVFPPSQRDAQPSAFLQPFPAFLPHHHLPGDEAEGCGGREGSVLSFPTKARTLTGREQGPSPGPIAGLLQGDLQLPPGEENVPHTHMALSDQKEVCE